MSQDAHQQGPFDELLGVLGELQNVLAEMKDTYEPEEMRYLDFLAKWYKYYPNVPCTWENYKHIHADVSRLIAICEKYYSSDNAQDVPDRLKMEHTRQYLNQFQEFLELVKEFALNSSYPAFTEEGQSPLGYWSYFRENIELAEQIRYYRTLSKRYPELDCSCISYPQKLEILSAISERDNTQVFRARMEDGKEVAVKYLPLREVDFASLIRWLNFNRNWYHDDIMGIEKAWIACRFNQVELRYYLCVVTPLADNLYSGLVTYNNAYEPLNLAQLVQYAGKIQPAEIMLILSPVVSALEPIHEIGGFHGNVSRENILFFDGCAKLTDTGLHVAEINEFIDAKKRTLPPAKSRNLRNDNDISQFCMVMYSLLTGHEPKLYPAVPVEILRTPEGKMLNRFILESVNMEDFEEFTAAWEHLQWEIQ